MRSARGGPLARDLLPSGLCCSWQAGKPGLAALVSSCPSPGSESPLCFPAQVALNLFLLTQELYL